MAILRLILLILTATLLTGCYEDFNPDIETKPVLCLNSLITAGEPIDVRVSRTWMFNEDRSKENHEVSDARITILVNEKVVDSTYLPKEGDKIRIIAESPAYGSATAEVVVPHSTPIGNVKVTPLVTDLWKGDQDFYHDLLADITFNLNIEMEINDPPGTDNYYQFNYNWFSPSSSDNPDDNMTPYYHTTFYMGQLKTNSEPIFQEHIGVLETVTGNGDDIDFLFFTNRQFSGKSYTLHLNFTGCGCIIKAPENDESFLECGVNLYLISVSKSYYSWEVYKWNVDVGIIGDLSNIGLAESKWGYSNVSTGAGVVAAQTISQFTIDLKDFIKGTLDPVP